MMGLSDQEKVWYL